MDEWLRMQEHPRIRFGPTNTGERRAALLAGPQIWTVAASWLQHNPADRDAETIADAIGLPVIDVEAAIGYWAAYRAEIDQLIEQHRADQDAAQAEWEQRQALRGV